MMFRSNFLLLTLFFLSACSSAAEKAANVGSVVKEETKPPPNFIVLIGDDMGVETLPCYAVGTQMATTPTLDNLCATGMRFDNFWSQPVCSPTRATILTGQYGFRNGVGTPATGPDEDYPEPAIPAGTTPEFGAGGGNAAPAAAGGPRRGNGGGGGGGRRNNAAASNDTDDGRPGLLASAYGLPSALAADTSLGYQSAAIGKWHLADSENGGLHHPSNVGFDHYAGSIRSGGVASFFAWTKVVDGELTNGETGYVTSATVDDAVEWLDARNPAKPFLLWVAFNAPHTPWGKPPPELLSDATNRALESADENNNAVQIYNAMIEAMDTEIGRLLEQLPANERNNTYVVFIGDNGTPAAMVTDPVPRGRAKGSVYQGGVNVPLIITGPGVAAGSSTKALANSVDLFATVVDLAGTAHDPKLADTPLDSVSLVPTLSNPDSVVRDFAFADSFGPQRNGMRKQQAIRNARYKIFLDHIAGIEAFYDLQADPHEADNLLDGDLTADEKAHYGALTSQLEALLLSHQQ